MASRLMADETGQGIAVALHISVDFDGVLCDFAGGLVAAVNQEFGARLSPLITEYDLSKTLDPIIGYRWMDWLEERPHLWGEFPPIPGALEGLASLRDRHYLEIVTAKPRWAERAVWEFMEKHRPSVDAVTIIGMGEDKTDVTEAPVLIDDRIEECEWFLDDGRDAILLAQPYNQGDIEYRVDGWAAAVARVEEIAKAQADTWNEAYPR